MVVANTNLARPYAKAAFEYAVEKHDVKAWDTFLQVAKIIASDERMHQMLEHPSISEEECLKIFLDICEKNLDQARKNFLHILTEARRLNLLPAIAESFEFFKNQQEQIVDVDVITVLPLSDEQKKNLASSLEKRLKCSVKLNYQEDKSLLGGAVIRAGDLVIDRSVRSALLELANVMTQA